MRADVFGLDGKKTGTIELPRVFSTPYRPDLILRAVLAHQSTRRQAYGTDSMAGQRTSAHYHGYRRLALDSVMMNREMARLPRLHGDTPTHMFMRARLVSGVVGGRTVHGPRSDRVWKQKINSKERVAALRSAIAATAKPELVKQRNHVFKEVPLVVSDEIQNIEKTKKLKEVLVALGLGEELDRTAKKKIRAGKGKRRGRRHKTRKGPLLVVAGNTAVVRAASGILGLDVVNVKTLNTEMLSPGAHGARLTLWTRSAVEAVGKKYR